MADTDDIVFLRDSSLEDKVVALVAGIASHPDRIEVTAYDDGDDPYHLAIYVYATSFPQLDEWIAEIRRRLADQLDVTDAPTGRELESAAV
jgi:hypothetical protein